MRTYEPGYLAAAYAVPTLGQSADDASAPACGNWASYRDGVLLADWQQATDKSAAFKDGANSMAKLKAEVAANRSTNLTAGRAAVALKLLDTTAQVVADLLQIDPVTGLLKTAATSTLKAVADTASASSFVAKVMQDGTAGPPSSRAL